MNSREFLHEVAGAGESGAASRLDQIELEAVLLGGGDMQRLSLPRRAPMDFARAMLDPFPASL